MIQRGIMILLLLIAIPAQAEWGRLFYTPQERAALNSGATTTVQATEPTMHYFNGEVQQHNGNTLHWVDGKIIHTPPPKTVKPGEHWDAGTGKVYPAGKGP